MSRKKTNIDDEKSKWYKKLEREGFNDIEQDEDNLKVWSSVFSKRHSIEQIQAKQVYYQMATNFLEDYEFGIRREEIIWAYHSEGISYRNISKLLKKVRIKLSHTAVQNIVHKLQVSMYLLYKTPTEGLTQ